MRRPTRTAVFATAAVATSTAIARAEHESVTLRYSGAKSARSCPDEATFRGLVAARLGYDPFVGSSERVLTVEFTRDDNEVLGRLHLSDHEKPLKRTLRAGSDDCFELATSMALVVAVAVDPNAASSPVETPPPTSAPPRTVEPVARVAPERNPPRSARAREPVQPEPGVQNVRLELGALLSAGIVPAPAAGARAGVSLDFGRWSAGAEAGFFSEQSRKNPAGAGEVSAWAFAGSLVPCVAPIDSEGFTVELCAVGSLGVLRSTAQNVERAAPASTLLASIGPRVAAIAMLSRAVGIGASAEVPVALSRTHLHIEEAGVDDAVWATAPMGFVAGISLVATIR